MSRKKLTVNMFKTKFATCIKGLNTLKDYKKYLGGICYNEVSVNLLHCHDWFARFPIGQEIFLLFITDVEQVEVHDSTK